MSAASVLAGLPQLAFDYTIDNDQDWNDGGIAYADAQGNPQDLTGITVAITVRKAAGDPSVLWFADTTGDSVLLLPVTVGGVPSAWCIWVLAADLPVFLPVNTTAQPSYVYAVQGMVGGATKTLASGSLIVNAGIA